MPRRTPHAVRWSPQTHSYEIIKNDTRDLLIPDTPAWFSWLESITSFAFYSQSGAYCTARKEAIKQSGSYWYAYRSIQRRTSKQYIGRTSEVTIARLEEVTERFQHTEASQAAEHESIPPLLEVKLHPPRLPKGLISRPELFQRLDDWQSYRLTLLSAPAGFGKSTLLNQWLSERQTSIRAVWVALDSGDNDPLRFWYTILHACQSWLQTTDDRLASLLHAASPLAFQPLSLEEIIATFLNKLASDTSGNLLVLEDYHFITNTRIHELLDFFITHLPQNMHVILLSRHEPPLPLARLRARGELNEFQATDLRFSLSETEAFLWQTASLSLPSETLEQLHERVEGWPTGLRLLSLSLQRQQTQEQIQHTISHFNGTQRQVREYFVLEVLQALPEPLQTFLLCTSILPRLHPSLCAEVSGNQESGALLEAMERTNGFLETLDDEWYRYHALFAEAMQHEARRQLGEDEIRRLYSIAARWLMEHDFQAEAIEAALKAEDYECACAFIKRYISKYLQFQAIHEYITISQWIQQLPSHYLHNSAELCLTKAMVLFFKHDEEAELRSDIQHQATELLNRAEALCQETENDAIQAQIDAFRAMLDFRFNQQELAVIYASRALEKLAETATGWRASSLMVLGVSSLQQGQLDQARGYLEQAQQQWRAVGSADAARGMSFLLAMLCIEQGKLHQAIKYYQEFEQSQGPEPINERMQAYAIASLGQTQILYEWNDQHAMQQKMQDLLGVIEQAEANIYEFLTIPIKITEARLLHLEGKTEQACSILSQLLKYWSNMQPSFSHLFHSDILVSYVQYTLLLGDTATAQYWLETFMSKQGIRALPAPDQPAAAPIQEHSTTLFNGALSDTLHEQLSLLHARILLFQGESEKVLHLLSSMLASAIEAGRIRSALQIKLLLARAYAALEQPIRARTLLQETLEAAYPEGFQRLFLDEGPALQALLRDSLPYFTSPTIRKYAHDLIQSMPCPATVVTELSPLQDSLSQQELRVLRLLSSGLSNAEIAREHIVSINTIRSQVQSIYRKLQVHNRHAASETARRLGLL
uniref:LuxR family transcriptional regulator n=1 Tax=Thermosporothrix sp. COM3 TaxID=2490863 RepID=A0A455SH50_9CHLR|nr:LuxR family transcriptional regulator [Thermosporothrix sp. COM3]